MLPVNGSLHMAPLFPRSGPGESSSPMSQVLLRCYDFPSRLSGRLFVSLPGSTLPSSVRVSQLTLALPEGQRMPSGPGHCSAGDPAAGLLSRGRERDLPGSQAIRPVPLPRSRTPVEPTTPRLLTVSSMLPPLPSQRGLQPLEISGLLRGFSTCCLRFTNGVAIIHAKLASGWLARLYREGVEPFGSLQKVSDHPSSFSGLSLAQGKFHFEPPSHHLITSSARMEVEAMLFYGRRGQSIFTTAHSARRRASTGAARHPRYPGRSKG